MKPLFTLVVTLAIASAAWADVELPNIINSKMVLQRGTQVPIWGWADQGEEVTVSFEGQTKRAIATGPKGEWRVTLDPMEASSEPRVMTIKGKNEITLTDILVGEVWLASGQSNMEFSIADLAPQDKALIDAQTSNTLFRMFCIPNRISAPIPLDDTEGEPIPASDELNKMWQTVWGLGYGLWGAG